MKLCVWVKEMKTQNIEVCAGTLASLRLVTTSLQVDRLPSVYLQSNVLMSIKIPS